MPGKRRYLVGFKRSAVVPKDIETAVDSFVAEQEQVQQLRKLKGGQSVVEMTAEEAAKLAAKRPDLAVEEDLELEHFSPMPGLAPQVPTGTQVTLTFKVVDDETGKPVGRVTIYCVGQSVVYKGETGKNGIAKVVVMEKALKRVIASPRDGYWSKVAAPPAVDENARTGIGLDKLPVSGDYTWGHLSLGVDKVGGKFTGKGVKIAVIDSGIAPHEDLKTAAGYNTLDGQDPAACNVDEKGHGTHCCGILAAQINAVGIKGTAPAAEICSLKIFPGGRFSDLIEAINWCIENYVDVISMSLGSRLPSQQIEQALLDAYDRGITCVAAAGNDAGAVAYPAAYSHVIAVSAVGKKGTFPEDSAHALKVGAYAGDGNLFFAAFSNFGREIDVCAPGVAIQSTVPTGYAAWDGTSMACPYITGLAALVLEAYPEIRTGDAYQPYYVHQIISSSATDIGLPPEMQGAGLANAAAALGGAQDRREREDAELAAYRNHLEQMLARARTCASDMEQLLVRLEETC